MDLLENLSNSYDSNSAIITDENDVITYGELKKISFYFKNLIPRRSLVFSLNKNSIGSLCGYVSFLKTEVVPLMLDCKMDMSLLEKLISIYKPQYIWLPTDDVIKFPNGQLVSSLYDYSLLKFNNEVEINLNDELALLLTTSGSTGSPKLVRISYENIKSNAVSIIESLSINSNERPITTLPMSYSFGLSIINSHLYTGAKLLLTNQSLFEKKFWIFIKQQKATSISGVPYLFEMLKKLRFTKTDLPYLTTLTQAGGKMNTDLIREFSEYCQNNNKKLFVMYGQTEATARMSCLPHEKCIQKLGSIGLAIPGGKFSLLDGEGNTISQSNIEGELVYEGRNVSLGYAECLEDLSKSDENNGKLLTGDLAKRDQDGYYYIVGRKKRFVKIFGNRINLDEMESLIKNIISDCACVGNDDKIFIYITDDSRIKDVSSFLTEKTSINSSAFSIRIIDFIPKYSSGKTNYLSLKLE